MTLIVQDFREIVGPTCGAHRPHSTHRCNRTAGHTTNHHGYDHLGRWLAWPVEPVEADVSFEPSDADIEEYLAWRVGDDVRLVPNTDDYARNMIRVRWLVWSTS